MYLHCITWLLLSQRKMSRRFLKNPYKSCPHLKQKQATDHTVQEKKSNWQGMGNLLKPPRQYLNWTVVEVKRPQNVALRCPNGNCALWEPTNVGYNILRDSGKLLWKGPFQDTGKRIDKAFQVPGLTDCRGFHALKRWYTGWREEE